VSSLRVGKILGVPLVIDYTWFIAIGLMAWWLATSFFPRYYLGLSFPYYWVLGIVAAILLFGSVLLHELSHSLMAIKRGLTIRRINLFIFGGVAEITAEPPSARAELRIAIVGPLTSIGLATFFWLFNQGVKYWSPNITAHALSFYLYSANITLAIFNLIPAFPLDGGRILRAGLWARMQNIRKATRIASTIGSIFAFFLMFIGFMNFLFGMLINGIWLIIIGWFLDRASRASYQQLILRESLTGVLVREIMSPDLHTVSGSITLQELVGEYFLKHRYTCFPVRGNGEVVGFITLHDVKRIPQEDWSYTRVSEVMTVLNDKVTIGPDEEAVNAFSRMIKNAVSRLMVVEGNRLVGIITLKDITNLFKIRTDLGL